MGMFWSMVKKTEGTNPGVVRGNELKPMVMHFTAASDGSENASASLERIFCAPGVKRTEVRERGLVGTFFEPPGRGGVPGIVVVGGSVGGLTEARAALLASHGFTALALAYFGVAGLPKYLSEIPLEYFDTALQWLNSQESVIDGKLGVMGQSRGGELALLLGATFSSVRAVVAFVPSGIVHGGFPDDGPAWAYRDAPIPYISLDPTPFSNAPVGDRDAVTLTPVFLRELLIEALTQPDLTASTGIPVERTNGPILFISGEDDQMWPSFVLSEISVARLKAHHHPYSFEHLSYEGAGHGINIPYLPTTETSIKHPVDGRVYDLGGCPVKNAVANADSWKRMLRFFETALKQ